MTAQSVCVQHLNPQTKIVTEYRVRAGKLHHRSLPAVRSRNDRGATVYEAFYRNGVLHNDVGPAQSWFDSFGEVVEQRWYCNGALARHGTCIIKTDFDSGLELQVNTTGVGPVYVISGFLSMEQLAWSDDGVSFYSCHDGSRLDSCPAWHTLVDPVRRDVNEVRQPADYPVDQWALKNVLQIA